MSSSRCVLPPRAFAICCIPARTRLIVIHICYFSLSPSRLREAPDVDVTTNGELPALSIPSPRVSLPQRRCLTLQRLWLPRRQLTFSSSSSRSLVSIHLLPRQGKRGLGKKRLELTFHPSFPIVIQSLPTSPQQRSSSKPCRLSMERRPSAYTTQRSTRSRRARGGYGTRPSCRELDFLLLFGRKRCSSRPV